MDILKKLFAVSAAVLLLAGCATHKSEMEKACADFDAGNVAAAEQLIRQSVAEKVGTGDELVWQLELGASARANADFKTSGEAFDKASELIEKFEGESETRLTEETEAIFTNQSYIPYKGYNYDKIMMSIYRSMNYMETKDFERAATSLKQLEFFQANAERSNIERIEKQERALKKAQAESVKIAEKNAEKNANTASQTKQLCDTNYDARRTIEDPQTNARFKKIYGENYFRDISDMKAKGKYINPFGYWISGVFFINKAADSADKSNAATFFRLARESLGNNSEMLAADMLRAEDFASGKSTKAPDVTYVVYEMGRAPVRNQVRVDLPLYIVAKNVPHIGMNFPYLKKTDFVGQDVVVTVGDKIVSFDKIADMDEIISEDFYNELPYVITKTIISAAVKATAQYFAAQAAGDYGWAVNLIGSAYQIMMNDADLRTWSMLPKQIKVASFATPADGIICVEGRKISVSPKGGNVVIIKKTSPASPAFVRVFDFSEKVAQPAATVVPASGSGNTSVPVSKPAAAAVENKQIKG